MFVKFTVEISEERFSYQGKRVESETQIEVTREVLDNLNTGNILDGLTKSALKAFDEQEPEEAS
ncbi:MAG: hypothetical protein HOJ31_10190 [Anaerolineae bacterium]|nr:hypothetical protein [Anaerolineae bacterium]